MIAISGMMNPPRSSFSSLVAAPLRSATDSADADGADCARTGVLIIETASIAPKDAFLKLISNSLLSWHVWHCHSVPRLTTLKLVSFRRPKECCLFAQGVARFGPAVRI
jgi:hypothetical protein